MLHEFLALHREELIHRTREKVLRRLAPRATAAELEMGVPLFLTQLTETLRVAEVPHGEDDSQIGRSAKAHGSGLLRRGFTIAQVVHDYADVCQAVTELAVETGEPISAGDYRIFNKCLDEAISQAVTGYENDRAKMSSDEENQRLGFFAHELRNLLHTSLISYEVLKRGELGINGSTGRLLERSLRRLAALVDQSLTEVRLTTGVHTLLPVRLAEFIQEMEVEASIEAGSRELHLIVAAVEYELMIEVDRQLLASAVTNLLNNAFKFSRRRGTVTLRTNSTPERVRIEVEDQCGGLPPGAAEGLFTPFEQRGVDRHGLGLGLAISRKAIEANGGMLTVTDLPGLGCVFAVDLPRASRGPAVTNAIEVEGLSS